MLACASAGPATPTRIHRVAFLLTAERGACCGGRLARDVIVLRGPVGPLFAVLTLVVTVGMTACGGSSGAGDEVRVAAAASLTEVVDDVGAELSSSAPLLRVRPDIGASPTLARQILDGSPVDVFLAADEHAMGTVDDAGLAGPVVTFATNRLAIAVPPGNPGGLTGLDDFARPDLVLGRCAAEVPCGRLAVAELDDAHIADRTDTEEPDVRTLLAKVVAGELDGALVYVTDLVAARSGVDEIADPRLDRTSRYQAAPVEGGDATAARRFLEILTGPAGRASLERRGFGIPARVDPDG